jgi:hypothetical protein
MAPWIKRPDLVVFVRHLNSRHPSTGCKVYNDGLSEVSHLKSRSTSRRRALVLSEDRRNGRAAKAVRRIP